MKLIQYIDDNKYKIFKSILTYITFIGFGGTNTLMGSSLLDLQIRFQSSLRATSRLIPARAIGYVFGAISSGFFEKHLNNYLILSVANFFAGFFLILAAWCRYLELMIASVICSGYFQGLFDIYCNVTIFRIWGENGVNWLQVLYMSFGLGALITPVFTRPFLLPLANHQDIINIRSHNYNSSGTISMINSTLTFSPDQVKVQYSFMIVGALLAVNAIPFFFCYLYERQDYQIAAASNADDRENNQDQLALEWESGNRQANFIKKLGAIMLTAAISNFCFGTESVVGNLTTAFAVKADVQMDKKSAVLVATVFWTTSSFYRLIFIGLTFIFKESKIFYFNLMIIVIAVIVMVPNAAYDPNYTWIAFTLLGIGHSPIFSVSYGSLSRYFLVTSKMTSFIFINGVAGETIHSFVLSKYLDSKPNLFIYYLGFMSIIHVLLNLCLRFYCTKLFVKHHHSPSISPQSPPPPSKDLNEMQSLRRNSDRS